MTQSEYEEAQLFARFGDSEFYGPVTKFIHAVAMDFFSMPNAEKPGGMGSMCNWIVGMAADFFAGYRMTRLDQVVEAGRTLSEPPEPQRETTDDNETEHRDRA